MVLEVNITWKCHALQFLNLRSIYDMKVFHRDVHQNILLGASENVILTDSHDSNLENHVMKVRDYSALYDRKP
ncbi:10733_t:CDS:2 [Rhizophagus irregularis]|nr:10733_t:CDS:2 [Rhizophagus irregularis]